MSFSIAPSPDLLVVPTERLRALLGAQQCRFGVQLDQLMDNAPHLAGTSLAHPESIDDATLIDVAATFEASLGPLLPTRDQLEIDLAHRRMSAAGHDVRLRWRRSFEGVMRRYLVLVHQIRDIPAGSRFRPRNDDLQHLAAALTLPFPIVRTQLWRAIGFDARTDHSAAAKVRRVVAPAATVVMASVTLHVAKQALANAPGDSAELTLGDLSPNSAAHATTTVDQTAARIILPSAVGTAEAAPETAVALGLQALALIDYQWSERLPGWDIEFLDSRRGLLGYAFFHEQRIEIYVGADQSAYDIATVIAHEIGHAIDVTMFGDAERSAWLEARGIPDSAWWPNADGSDFASGAGDWAEGFASWLLDDTNQSALAGALSPSQQDLVAELAYR